MGVALTIWLDYNASADHETGSFWSKWYTRVAFLLLALTYGLSVGYSRILLGEHSFDQILFGLQLGSWMALTLHFCIREQIIEHATQLLDKRETRLFEMSLKCLGVIAALLIFVIVTYVVLNDSIVNDPIWSENILAKCSGINIYEAFLSVGMIDYY